MSTINGMSAEMLAGETDGIYIEATGLLQVRVTVALAGQGVVYDNAAPYQPVGGRIAIGELAGLCNGCIELTEGFGRLNEENTRNATCTLTVGLPDEGVSQSAKVWYCRKPIDGWTAGTAAFATTWRDRRVWMGQRIWLYAPNLSGLTVKHHMAALVDGEVVYYSDDEPFPNSGRDYVAVDASPGTEWSIVSREQGQLLFYDVELYKDGTLCDRVHFEVETATPRLRREMIYLNVFGVQEGMVLHGSDEETQTLDASFGYAGTLYKRYDTMLTEEHKTNSGWLERGEWEALTDMAESPSVAMKEARRTAGVVITAIEAKRARPSNEPVAATITWRQSGRGDMRRAVMAPVTTPMGVFERPPFDSTFS